MNKKLILTSIVALGFACPVMAATTTSTFPSNGRVQADYIYTNAATSTNLAGVHQNNSTVYAVAHYLNNRYTVPKGKYLPENSETPELCPAGYYCPQERTVEYNGADLYLKSCALESPVYQKSDLGSDELRDCYRDCVASDVEHSTTVTGRVFYGGTNTCTATACENGWSVSNGACVGNTINVTWYGTTAEAITLNNAGTVTYGGDVRTPASARNMVGMTFVGWTFSSKSAAEKAAECTAENPNSAQCEVMSEGIIIQ